MNMLRCSTRSDVDREPRLFSPLRLFTIDPRYLFVLRVQPVLRCSTRSDADREPAHVSFS